MDRRWRMAERKTRPLVGSSQLTPLSTLCWETVSRCQYCESQRLEWFILIARTQVSEHQIVHNLSHQSQPILPSPSITPLPPSGTFYPTQCSNQRCTYTVKISQGPCLESRKVKDISRESMPCQVQT